jgi:hypothetical protein
MSQMRIFLRSAPLAVAFVCLFVSASAVAAGAPAQVTVRVEGLSETKVPPIIVTTTTNPVVKDGNSADSCPGASALGALDLATAGNWNGPWEAKYNQYSIFTIEGETHEFEESASANYFWSFWLNDKDSELGACETELQPGDRVLLYPSCYGTSCPMPEPTPLEIEAPTAANVGEATAVTVKRYNTEGEASPAVGASVIGGGAGATTDSQGHATLKFFGAGTYTLLVNGAAAGPPAVRTETTICVHAGNDGTCGTQPTLFACATESVPSSGCGGPPIVVPQQSALTTLAGGVKTGHVYSRRKAPRILKGVVTVPSGGTLKDVRISLERRSGKRCFAFNGVKERFVKGLCGAARFFSVSNTESFSYLLPASLPAGRYVYDIEAIDGTGKPTKLVPGISHVVFYVK